MALADALATVLATKPGPKCMIDRLFSILEPDERADYVALLADDRYSANTVVKAVNLELKDRFKVGRSSVERHRRGECACGSR